MKLNDQKGPPNGGPAFSHITIRIPGSLERKRAYNRAAARAGKSLADWTSETLDRAADYRHEKPED